MAAADAVVVAADGGAEEATDMNTMIANWIRFLAVAALALLVAGCNKPPAGTFETPEQAVQALDGLLGKHDQAGVETVFGPGSMEMFSSGDDNEDADYFSLMRRNLAALRKALGCR